MGLDVSHGCWQGAYSSFKEWRTKLAELAGLNYKDLSDLCTEETVQGIWEVDPEDVLFVLLLHSDCDYSIPTRFCSPLADRLEQLLSLHKSEDENYSEYQFSFKSRTKQFVAGLRTAAFDKADIYFE